MLNTLQAGRAVAALLVLTFHASGSIFALPKYFDSRPFGSLFDFGYAGVDFFFVLSGFIMLHVHRSDLGTPARFTRYLLRRARRLVPTYWAVFILVAPHFFLLPSFGDGSQRDLGVALRSFFLLPQPEGISPILVVSWSLVFEVFFYLIFGLLILDCRLGLAAFVLWLAIVVVRPWAGVYPWDFLSSHHHFKFFAGLAVAEAVHRNLVPAPRALTLAGLAIFLATGFGSTHGVAMSELTRSGGFTLGSALLIAGLVAWEQTRAVPVPRLAVFLGEASYSIYLVHFPVLSALAKASKALRLDTVLPHALLFLAFVGLATAAGVVFHCLIERRLSGMRRGAAVAGRVTPASPGTEKRAA